MTTLSDIHRAVRTALDSGRLGAPVFVRYLYRRTMHGPGAVARLARTTAVVRDWLGQPLERVYALGGPASRHVALTLEFRGGPTALVTWLGTAGSGTGVDLIVLGNRGAIYRDGFMADPWDDPAQVEEAEPDQELIGLIERALSTGRPENAGGQE